MQLHHHTYDRVGGSELLTDLRPLCDDHHSAVHAYQKHHGCDLLEAFDAVSNGAPR